MSDKDPLLAVNVNKPRLLVKHSELELLSNDSAYRCQCPACERGVLLMMRDPNTFMLLSVDRCLLCCQEVEYTDIPNGELMALMPQQEPLSPSSEG